MIRVTLMVLIMLSAADIMLFDSKYSTTAGYIANDVIRSFSAR